MQSLKLLQKVIAPNGEELNQVIGFNDSTGAHVHFSMKYKKRNISFTKYATYSDLVAIRELYFKRIEESQILSEKTKASITTHYFRYYSQEQEKPRRSRNPIAYKFNKRYNEFNFLSEQLNKGLEWRSVSLRGVQTWNEFFEVFNIAHDCVMELCKRIIHAPSIHKKIDFTEIIADLNQNEPHNPVIAMDTAPGNDMASPKNED